MSWLIRLFCRLGLHAWTEHNTRRRTCLQCGKRQRLTRNPWQYDRWSDE